jgi:hypothetical protein
MHCVRPRLMRCPMAVLVVWLFCVAEPVVAQEPEPSTEADGSGSSVLEGDLAADSDVPGVELVRGLRLSGFVQAQYSANQLSEDQLANGGIPLNRDRFVLRRARVRLDYAGAWSSAQLELDGNTNRGAAMSIRRGNVGFWFGGESPRNAALRIRLGLTEVPFGSELRMGQEELLFMERSAGSIAYFGGPTDTGVRVNGELGAFRYDVAVQNGTPVDDFGGGFSSDPTRAPDVAFRFGVEPAAAGPVAVEAGLSGLTGTGFSPGTDAGKPRVEWRDLNENESLDTGELVAIPGRGAVPSYTYRRWAAALDAQAVLLTAGGETRVNAEASIASNLNRGAGALDPLVAGYDIRHSHWLVSLTHQWNDLLLGARYDVFDPDSDLLYDRRGFRVPQDARVRTISALAGVRVRDVGRFMLQYDAIQDRLGRDASGVPTDIRNNVWTLRLQGEF